MQSRFRWNDIYDPFGKSSTFNKTMILKQYTQEFMRIADFIHVRVCNHKGATYLHFTVPSKGSNTSEIWYDVVFEFDDSVDSVYESPVKVFSNAPSFMYTYTYAWNYHGGLSDEFKKRCSQQALTMAPMKKNPNLVLGYEPTLWQSALYLRHRRLTSLNSIRHTYSEIGFNEFFLKIKSQQDKLTERDITDRHNRTAAKHEQEMLKKRDKEEKTGSKKTEGTKTLNKTSGTKGTRNIVEPVKSKGTRAPKQAKEARRTVVARQPRKRR